MDGLDVLTKDNDVSLVTNMNHAIMIQSDRMDEGHPNHTRMDHVGIPMVVKMHDDHARDCLNYHKAIHLCHGELAILLQIHI